MLRVRSLLHLVGLGCAALLGVEAASRLDDWVHYETPVLASPSRERDLVQIEGWGIRGRSMGLYRKWKLDSNGFREIPFNPPSDSGCPRLLVLGASETLGLYESPEHEYPAQLARLLQEKEPCEVMNAAMAGIMLPTLIVFWDHWASQFHPGHVLIYPSPQFYLDNNPPAFHAPRLATPEGQFAWMSWRPRLLDRAQSLWHQLPDRLTAVREDWEIARQVSGKGEDWLFQEVPEERLRQFHDDLAELVVHVRRCGGEPILVTHASSAASPPRPEDEVYLRRMRMFFPRATPGTLVSFEQRANEEIRKLARKEHLLLIDADQALSGQRDLFADLCHFNDSGALKMAELLAEKLPPLQEKKQKKCRQCHKEHFPGPGL